MDDDETMGTGGSGGGDQQPPFPPPPCGACGYMRRACRPGCIFAPIFPAGSEANFARISELYGVDDLTNAIAYLEQDLRITTVSFTVRETKAQADNSGQGRNLRVANATWLAMPRLSPELRPLDATAAQLDHHFRSVESAAPPNVNLQDPQEAGGGIDDVRGGADHEDRGDESIEVDGNGARAEASSLEANSVPAPAVFHDGCQSVMGEMERQSWIQRLTQHPHYSLRSPNQEPQEVGGESGMAAVADVNRAEASSSRYSSLEAAVVQLIDNMLAEEAAFQESEATPMEVGSGRVGSTHCGDGPALPGRVNGEIFKSILQQLLGDGESATEAVNVVTQAEASSSSSQSSVTEESAAAAAAAAFQESPAMATVVGSGMLGSSSLGRQVEEESCAEDDDFDVTEYLNLNGGQEEKGVDD